MRRIRMDRDILIVAGAVLGLCALFLTWSPLHYPHESALNIVLWSAYNSSLGMGCYAISIFLAGAVLSFMTRLGGIAMAAGCALFVSEVTSGVLHPFEVIGSGVYLGIAASGVVLASMFVSVTVDGAIRVKVLPRGTPISRRLFVPKAIESRLDVALETLRACGFIMCVISLSIGWLAAIPHPGWSVWDSLWHLSPLELVAPAYDGNLLYVVNVSILSWLGAYIFFAGVAMAPSRSWTAGVTAATGVFVAWVGFWAPAPYGSLYTGYYDTVPTVGFYLALTGAIIVILSSSRELWAVYRRVRPRPSTGKTASSLG